ncbi:MAG: SDR family oxidoreductase [Dehalococcoidia bacterium]|nr:SDR family oxidoreductase [Dehalococcoidia bacterium]
MSLEGRVALVTGATGGGIGRSIALTLAREGADIVVNYREKHERAAAVVAAVESMGRRVLPFAADVSDPLSVESMFEAAAARLAAVDIVVNSAGGAWKPQDITEIEPSHFRAVLADEVEATFLLMRAALPGMRARGWGRIISIGGYMADSWRFGSEAPLDYPLGKAGRHWLTRTLAPRELPHGITINAIAPGPTPYVSLEDALAAVGGGRLPREGNTPQDVADVAAFLCSDAAARVSGAVIPVPGARPL